jgi:hypothetical protein
MEPKKYVRCRYCDSDWYIEDIKITIMPPDETCPNGMGAFTCLDCKYHTISYIFVEDSE